MYYIYIYTYIYYIILYLYVYIHIYARVSLCRLKNNLQPFSKINSVLNYISCFNIGALSSV